jgi:pSer/pThr/pTyr-binding forkhead associated (FHA) protein
MQDTDYELTKDRIVIGRSPDCDISLDVPAMSRFHAQFVRTADGYSFEDLGSRNGSYVNGEGIGDRRVPLHNGDRIHTGAVILIYHRIET